MQAEDRPIHFSTELLHAPRALKVSALQRLYFELSQTKTAAYMNTDFSPQSPPRFHSRRGRQSQSMLIFLPDRMVVVEEWVDMPFSAFLQKVEAIITGASFTLETGPIVAVTSTVRTTFALTHHVNARTFLLDHVCGQEGRISPFFGRPVGIGGLRFVLPKTPENPGSLHIKIESYRRSQNEIYVEVKGVFLNQQIDAGTVSLASDCCRRVRGFINQSVQPYLAQFDLPTEARG